MTTHTPDFAGVIACLPLIVLLGLWLSLPLVTSPITIERILFLVSLRGVFVALAVGYLSHLIADAMTPHGIPLFFLTVKFTSCRVACGLGQERSGVSCCGCADVVDSRDRGV